MTDNTMKLLAFSRAIGRLKSIPRTGWLRKNISNPESVAEHMHRVAMFAFLLDPNAVDVTKCIKMSLVHDMGESIIGDLTPWCGVSQEEKVKMEREAVRDIAKMVPSSVEQEFISLWEEYEAAKTPEALAVKDLDKFEMIAQAYEYEQDLDSPAALQEFFDSTRGKFRTETVKRWVEELETNRNANTSVPKETAN